ncbi:MAG: GPR endopeptidase [Clostridiales bacterium]|nr:GPR endopeptidase [Clostridiales bacterium]
MQIRTDLAMESRACAGGLKGVTTRTAQNGRMEETYVTIETEEAAKKLAKACGRYVTLSHPELARADVEERKEIVRALSKIIRDMLPGNGDLMIVGLGNRHITADALGSRVLESLLVTRHLRQVIEPELQGRLRGVCAVAPGVLGITGVETAEMVQGIVEKVHPSAVIAIDALAARETGRICTTIQVTDTGIRPGSGVGNHRRGLTQDTLGVPVIAIGVPMVVYAAVIARDALSMLLEDFDAEENEHAVAADALADKVTRQGLGDLVVTPREVDCLVGKVAQIIAAGLNQALQPRLSEEEILLLSHDGP